MVKPGSMVSDIWLKPQFWEIEKNEFDWYSVIGRAYWQVRAPPSSKTNCLNEICTISFKCLIVLWRKRFEVDSMQQAVDLSILWKSIAQLWNLKWIPWIYLSLVIDVCKRNIERKTTWSCWGLKTMWACVSYKLVFSNSSNVGKLNFYKSFSKKKRQELGIDLGLIKPQQIWGERDKRFEIYSIRRSSGGWNLMILVSCSGNIELFDQ